MVNLYKKLLFLNVSLLLLLNSSPLFSQLSLVKDLNLQPQSSYPENFTEVNGIKFFTATTSTHGNELWKTDGTEAGTVMVKDIYPGHQGSNINALASFNNILYFAANDGIHGYELWKSDGTAAGTVMVKDINEGPESSSANLLTVVNGQLLFIAIDKIHGTALWKSDGSSTGTIMIKDIVPGNANTTFDYLIEINNSLFFVADDKIHGTELWKSDGTADGTVLIKDINPGLSPSYPARFAKVNNLLYFTANNGVNGNELWKSDGTEAGTVMVKDIKTGSESSYAYLLTNVNGTLFFNAESRLWKSDGTDAGTVKVSEAVQNPVNLKNINGTLFFVGEDIVNGKELWKSDGTAAGTVLVKDIASGTASSAIYSITNVNGVAYFVANDGIHSSELWKSDGTASGTIMVKDINPETYSNIYELFNLSGKLYFRADGKGNGIELWMSDGTSDGTVFIKDINTSSISSDPYGFIEVNGKVYFNVEDYPREYLYKTDGTEAGTSFLKEGVDGYSLTRVNQTLYFVGYTSSDAAEIWKSDGTAEGTVKVKDIEPGSAGSNPDNLTAVNNILYFTANDSHGYELWKSDGTEAGTVMVKDIEPGAGNSHPENLTNVNGVLYFKAFTHSQLWKSDGTAEGTVLVKKMAEPWSGLIDELKESNGKLFFTYRDNNNVQSLYISDGTEAGTKLLKTLWSTAAIINLTDVNGTLFFTAIENGDGDGSENRGAELWKSDGTPAGTVLVKVISDGSFACDLSELTVVKNTLYFVSDLSNGTDLWKSDGTENGTVLVKNIDNSNESIAVNLMNVNGILYFQAGSANTERHLWMSFGSECNTIQLTRDPGFLVGNEMVALNNKLIMPVTSFEYGNEVYSYNTVNDIKIPVITVNTSNPVAPVLTSSEVTGIQWMKNGAAINGATSQNYTVTSSGLYSVKVSVGDCVYAISDEVSAVPVGIMSQPTSLVQCAGTNAQFTVVASDTETLTYQWKKAGVNIAGANTATLTLNQIAAADAADYTAEIKGSFGTITSNAATLTVNPVTSITAQPANLAQCSGTNATLTVQANGTGTLEYQWKKGGVNINGANSATLILNQIATADAATYTVDITGTCGTISSNAATLTVNQPPVVTLADFTSITVNSPALQLTGGSPAGGEYTYSGNVITQFTPSAAGSYSIAYRYTDPNTGCTNSATKTLTVNTSTGMGDISAAGNIKLFPNPATDHFVVEINSAEKQETELLLYKSSGTLVAREKAVLNEGLNKIQFNCHQYAKGSYLLKIVTGNSVTTLKITLN